ncbi:hypothetical protein NECID01_0049 [Nematocida sp. AWRm77]|nr:hypothetical protein NECID01_0049 [Nematocida sp. AWRm77]
MPISPKDVYRVVSKEHGVPLSLDALHMLGEKGKEEELERMAVLLSEKCLGRVAQEKDVADVLGTREHEGARVQVFPTHFAGEGCARYRALKERLGVETVPIASLKEGQECTVFGMVGEGKPVCLEDRDGSVCVEMHGDVNAHFLAPGVCVGLKGALCAKGFAKVFVASSVLLPECLDFSAPPRAEGSGSGSGSRSRSGSDDGDGDGDGERACNGLFFANFSPTPENAKNLSDALSIYKEAGILIACVVIMVEEKDTMENELSRLQSGVCAHHPFVEFVVLPGKTQKEYFYPLGEYRKTKNLVSTTNPTKLVLGTRTLLVGHFDLIDGVKGRCTVKGEQKEELARTFLTQASYNPFVLYTDLSHTEEYDSIVVGDRYDSYVQTHSKRAFAMCGDFKKNNGQFLFFSADTNTFEISGLAPARSS